jgi:hypothetical protein
MLVHYLDVGGVQPPKPLALKVYWQDCVKALRMMTHITLTAACSLLDGLLTTFEMRSGHDEQNGVADAGRGKR